MVLELVPPDRPLKGGAVERLAREHGLRAVLYAGDDHADLDAFDALDRLIGSGTCARRSASPSGDRRRRRRWWTRPTWWPRARPGSSSSCGRSEARTS